MASRPSPGLRELTVNGMGQLDEETICHTPAPLASSTLCRGSEKDLLKRESSLSSLGILPPECIQSNIDLLSNGSIFAAKNSSGFCSKDAVNDVSQLEIQHSQSVDSLSGPVLTRTYFTGFSQSHFTLPKDEFHGVINASDVSTCEVKFEDSELEQMDREFEDIEMIRNAGLPECCHQPQAYKSALEMSVGKDQESFRSNIVEEQVDNLNLGLNDATYQENNSEVMQLNQDLDDESGSCLSSRLLETNSVQFESLEENKRAEGLQFADLLFPEDSWLSKDSNFPITPQTSNFGSGRSHVPSFGFCEAFKNDSLQQYCSKEFNNTLKNYSFGCVDVKAMLDEAEAEFQRENPSLKMADESCVTAVDDWIIPTSNFVGPADKQMSIATFIASRTEALGSLDGDLDVPRPEFGRKIISPQKMNELTEEADNNSLEIANAGSTCNESLVQLQGKDDATVKQIAVDECANTDKNEVAGRLGDFEKTKQLQTGEREEDATIRGTPISQREQQKTTAEMAPQSEIHESGSSALHDMTWKSPRLKHSAENMHTFSAKKLFQNTLIKQDSLLNESSSSEIQNCGVNSDWEPVEPSYAEVKRLDSKCSSEDAEVAIYSGCIQAESQLSSIGHFGDTERNIKMDSSVDLVTNNSRKDNNQMLTHSEILKANLEQSVNQTNQFSSLNASASRCSIGCLYDFAKQLKDPVLVHDLDWSMDQANTFTELMSTMTPEMSEDASPQTALEFPAEMLIDVAEEVQISQVCCVGISGSAYLSIQNNSSQWVECCVEIIKVSCNGWLIDTDQYMPFQITDKIIIKPSVTSETLILFLAREEGSYDARIKVTPAVYAGEKLKVADPLYVILKGIAEMPCLKIENAFLDFGTLCWGLSRCLSLRLINKGRSTVPLRLAIYSRNSCFSFKNKEDNSPALSLKNILISVSLKGSKVGFNEEVCVVTVCCKLPEKRYIKGNAPLEELLGEIKVQLDLPISLSMTLGMVNLAVLAGVAKLHIPQCLNMVSIKCVSGESKGQQTVMMKNAGNMDINVTLGLTRHLDVFTLKTLAVTVPVGKIVNVSIGFIPKTMAEKEYTTEMVMFIEPHGPLYEVPIHGKVVSSCVPKSKWILGNKRFMEFGGIQLKGRKNELVVLKNTSNKVLKVNLSIRPGSEYFQLCTKFDDKEILTKSKEVSIKPGDEYSIMITFAASRPIGVSSKLHVNALEESIKLSIPLFGYGGTSQVDVGEVFKSDTCNNFICIPSKCAKNSGMHRLNIRNTGQRAAYVKFLAFKDFDCKITLDSKEFSICPNQFVLNAAEMKHVVLNYSPAFLNSVQFGPIAFILLYHGDECTRLRFKRSLQGFSLSKPTQSHIDLFAVQFAGENVDCDDVAMLNGPDDVQLFENAISRRIFYVVREVVPSFEQLGVTQDLYQNKDKNWNSNEKTIREEHQANLRDRLPILNNAQYQPNSPPVKETTDALPQVQWKLIPDNIVFIPLHDAFCDARIKKFCIMNNSYMVLEFKITYPSEFLCVTPEACTVSKRSSLHVCVEALLDKPREGIIAVTCMGQSQFLRVCVAAETHGMSTLTANVMTDSRNQGAPLNKPTDTVDTVSTELHRENMVHIQNDEIVFYLYDNQLYAENKLVITNPTENLVTWSISFIEDADSTHRLNEDLKTSQIFTFAQMSGQLPPKKTRRILARCDLECVQNLREFSQLCELHVTCVINKTGTKSKPIKLIAKQVSLETVSNDPEGMHNGGTKATSVCSCTSSKVPHEKKKRWIIVKEDHVSFDKCQVNTSHIVKIRVVNQLEKPCKIEIEPPNFPFKATHLSFTVTGRKYMRIPVLFAPTFPGIYREKLLLKAEYGDTFCVDLLGEGV